MLSVITSRLGRPATDLEALFSQHDTAPSARHQLCAIAGASGLLRGGSASLGGVEATAVVCPDVEREYPEYK